MRININGQPEHTDAVTVGDLLRQYDIPPIRVAVELNRELVPRAEYDQKTLNSDDRIEIVTFVGGG